MLSAAERKERLNEIFHQSKCIITSNLPMTPCFLIFNVVGIEILKISIILKCFAVSQTILKFQSPTSGLFPLETTDDCNIGDIRTTIYCALSTWALHLSYRKILSDDGGRTHLLSQTAVKAMRGILRCWMYQIPKVRHKSPSEHAKCFHIDCYQRISASEPNQFFLSKTETVKDYS